MIYLKGYCSRSPHQFKSEGHRQKLFYICEEQRVNLYPWSLYLFEMKALLKWWWAVSMTIYFPVSASVFEGPFKASCNWSVPVVMIPDWEVQWQCYINTKFPHDLRLTENHERSSSRAIGPQGRPGVYQLRSWTSTVLRLSNLYQSVNPDLLCLERKSGWWPSRRRIENFRVRQHIWLWPQWVIASMFSSFWNVWKDSSQSADTH